VLNYNNNPFELIIVRTAWFIQTQKRKWIDALVLLRHYHMDPRRSSKNRIWVTCPPEKLLIGSRRQGFSGTEKYFSEGKIFTRTGQMTCPRVNGQTN
jgi:hypothetical protein